MLKYKNLALKYPGYQTYGPTKIIKDKNEDDKLPY